MFLWQGGDPLQLDDVLYPVAFFAGFTAASIGLGRFVKKFEPEEPPLIGITEEELRTIEADEKVFAALERRKKIFQWVVLGSPLWLMGGCMGYTMLDSLRGIRELSQFKQCVNNMRAFESAQKEFESRQHRPFRSVEEFVAIAKPADLSCSAGGKYSLARDDAGKTVLSCTEHGWFDHFAPQRHQHM